MRQLPHSSLRIRSFSPSKQALTNQAGARVWKVKFDLGREIFAEKVGILQTIARSKLREQIASMEVDYILRFFVFKFLLTKKNEFDWNWLVCSLLTNLHYIELLCTKRAIRRCLQSLKSIIFTPEKKLVWSPDKPVMPGKRYCRSLWAQIHWKEGTWGNSWEQSRNSSTSKQA